MASDQEVADQRAAVEAAREAVRQARAGRSTTARDGENDIKLASLNTEEAMLKQELARLTGSAEVPAAAPAAETPAEAATEAPGSSRRGGRNQTEG